ncbi:MAG: translation elongation factor Ts [Rhodospirillales bacterium RIFCSPLOWO2_12_FULL_58_28]|nr:MAG: translation elongation factor Ts [Rhodospirillales bacterium RIFCSPLOWO2_02_FULL_58_16]OHC77970.1 MAG: translation elongation factor Ts [Rhodospirillales bacterium RIFCSPLOWO2_12_FULL_58_28]
MSEITASLVKELREKTGAGMMDCKKALTETSGNMEEAVDWLRKKGLSAAAKKAGRVASEGLVGVAANGNAGAVIEVNAETDFVARNDRFQEFVRTLAGLALENGSDLEALKGVAYLNTGRNVEEQLTYLIATIGENMSIRRAEVLRVDSGVVGSYIHNALAPGLGKIGVLVAIDSRADAAGLDALGRQLAMHVAAANPHAVSRNELDPADLEREKNILSDQARASGKPEDIIGKMVEGRLRKYYEEVCLVDQVYVIDGETRVGKAIEAAAKDVGAPVAVKGFVRFSLGEGIEKKKEDFAAEVAAVSGS